MPADRDIHQRTRAPACLLCVLPSLLIRYSLLRCRNNSLIEESYKTDEEFYYYCCKKVILFLEPSCKTESWVLFVELLSARFEWSLMLREIWGYHSLTRKHINRWMHMEMVQHLNRTSGVPLLATFRVENCKETTETTKMEAVAVPTGTKQPNQLTSTVNHWTPGYVSITTSFPPNLCCVSAFLPLRPGRVTWEHDGAGSYCQTCGLAKDNKTQKNHIVPMLLQIIWH